MYFLELLLYLIQLFIQSFYQAYKSLRESAKNQQFFYLKLIIYCNYRKKTCQPLHNSRFLIKIIREFDHNFSLFEVKTVVFIDLAL